MTVPSSTFTTDNPGEGVGEQDTKNRYTVCQRSGFKIKPDAISVEWNGVKVRAESYEPRNEQDFIRPHAELLTGPKKPEPVDKFVGTITVDDL